MTLTAARPFALQNGGRINSRDYIITQIMTRPLPKLVYTTLAVDALP